MPRAKKSARRGTTATTSASRSRPSTATRPATGSAATSFTSAPASRRRSIIRILPSWVISSGPGSSRHAGQPPRRPLAVKPPVAPRTMKRLGILDRRRRDIHRLPGSRARRARARLARCSARASPKERSPRAPRRRRFSTSCGGAIRRTFWQGYEVDVRRCVGSRPASRSHCLVRFPLGTVHARCILCRQPLEPGTRYELSSGEDAPLLAIRLVLGLGLDEPLPPMLVKLGTTRGTNALLTRTGARTAFVTTRGFADVLRIANQDRPRLFDLAIKKPEPLFSSGRRNRRAARRVRGTCSARRIRPTSARPSPDSSKTASSRWQSACLHAFANPAHEELVERIAQEVGFVEVSTSSRLSPLIKIVSRGDTTVVDAYLNPVLRDYVDRLQPVARRRPAAS